MGEVVIERQPTSPRILHEFIGDFTFQFYLQHLLTVARSFGVRQQKTALAESKAQAKRTLLNPCNQFRGGCDQLLGFFLSGGND